MVKLDDKIKKGALAFGIVSAGLLGSCGNDNKPEVKPLPKPQKPQFDREPLLNAYINGRYVLVYDSPDSDKKISMGEKAKVVINGREYVFSSLGDVNSVYNFFRTVEGRPVELISKEGRMIFLFRNIQNSGSYTWEITSSGDNLKVNAYLDGEKITYGPNPISGVFVNRNNPKDVYEFTAKKGYFVKVNGNKGEFIGEANHVPTEYTLYKTLGNPVDAFFLDLRDEGINQGDWIFVNTTKKTPISGYSEVTFSEDGSVSKTDKVNGQGNAYIIKVPILGKTKEFYINPEKKIMVDLDLLKEHATYSAFYTSPDGNFFSKSSESVEGKGEFLYNIFKRNLEQPADGKGYSLRVLGSKNGKIISMIINGPKYKGIFLADKNGNVIPVYETSKAPKNLYNAAISALNSFINSTYK